MSDKNHNNNCARAADLVSYLYGEIGEREETVFESHLADCRNCADELADFSSARFAVKEWRDAEFAHLQTPAFEIPFEAKPYNEPVNASSGSLLAGLRRFFSPPSIWATSAAALAIIVGLVLAATNLFEPELIADHGKDDSANIAVSSSIKLVEQPQLTPFIEQEIAKDSSFQPTAAVKNVAPEKREFARQNSSANNRKDSIVKVSAVSTKTGNARRAAGTVAWSGVKDFAKTERKNAPAVNRAAPTLSSFDEDEDNTLRLAELFEETGAGK